MNMGDNTINLFVIPIIEPDTETTRTCGVCCEQLEFSNFYKDGYDNKGKRRYRRDCKSCYATTRLQERRVGAKHQNTK